MNILPIIFYSFATLVILSAVMVIVAKNPVRSVLSLVLTFFAMSGIWALLEAEFLAFTLILVYVGAVMVLFLFIVMMLDIEISSIKFMFTRHLPMGLLVSLLVLGCLIYAVGPEALKNVPSNISNIQTIDAILPNTVQSLGILLYTQYLYPFLIAGVLLLVAIIAAISLTFRGEQHRKTQNIEKQVAVKKQDRLTLVSGKKEIL